MAEADGGLGATPSNVTPGNTKPDNTTPDNASSYNATPDNATPGKTKPTYNFTLRTQDVKALGTTFKVVFADEGSVSDPVVVGIHGAPATHLVYRYIVEGIVSRGYRMIIPNLPGMGFTDLDPDGIYNHTSEHKAVLIREFLSAIGVQSVAMVVGHSVAGHAACQLAADLAEEGRVRSLCMMASIGSRPHRLCQPYWLFYTMGQLGYYLAKVPLIGRVVRYLICTAIGAAGLRGLTRESRLLALYEIAQLQFSQFDADLDRVVGLDLPVLCIHSTDDEYVEPPILEDIAHRVGTRPEDWVRYDKAGATMETLRGVARKRVAEFVSGTHMVLYYFPRQVVDEIDAFHKAITADTEQCKL